MKKPFVILPFVSLLFFVLASFGFSHDKELDQKKNMSPRAFALVELFTSEGCSSCPPADEAVAAIAKEYPSNVFVLGFHVDYWDYLGWKDEFSAADYSNRQKEYASVFQLESIYTPQVVVNGRTQFTGSDKKKLNNSVEQALKNEENPLIEISAKAISTKEIAVTCKAKADGKSWLSIALVQSQAISAVKRGENKGKLLHHVDVVRNFKTVDGNTDAVTLSLPAGLAAKDCKVIAFLQNKTDRRITGAGESEIQ